MDNFFRLVSHIPNNLSFFQLHNGYGHLLDQFLQNGSNKRTDEYGGSVENRARLLLEVVDAISEAIGEQRVAVRFSPWNTYLNMEDTDPVAVFSCIRYFFFLFFTSSLLESS
jgi:2,4-dienoyl-CoA reductase-like NADH-dependent reductase (Old Yellow Enzyme family)